MQQYICNTCKIPKDADKYRYNKGLITGPNPLGRLYKCAECIDIASRDWVRNTIQGRISKTYSMMKRRVNGGIGQNERTITIYTGLAICTREEFYNWSINQPILLILMDNWKTANYSLMLTPSIDRLDTNQGYILDNIQWTTWADNCRSARLGKHSPRRWAKRPIFI